MKHAQTTPNVQVIIVNVMNKLYAHIFTINHGHISSMQH